MYGDERIISNNHLGEVELTESKGCLLTDRRTLAKTERWEIAWAAGQDLGGLSRTPSKKWWDCVLRY